MDIHIDQALYGEKDNAHSLLSHSFKNEKIPRSIILMSDLPSGHVNHPGSNFYIGSVVQDNYFILLKSIPDHQASRVAFVHTFAMFIQLEDLDKIDDLGAIIKLFPEVYSSDWRPETLLFNTEVHEDKNLSAVEPLELLLASHLLNNQNPIVWLGESGFVEAVCKLWCRIQPSLRKSIRFRVSFGPNDIDKTENLLLVNSPEILKDKWEDFSVIKSTDCFNGTVSPDLSYLLQLSDHENNLVEIFNSLEISLNEISAIKTISRLDQLILSEDLNDQLDAIYLLKNLSPDKNKGKELKRKIVSNINQILISGKLEDLLLFRNIEVDHLPGKTQFNGGFSSVLQSQLTVKKNIETAIVLLKSIDDTNVPNWFSNALKSELTSICSSWDNTVSTFFWGILEKTNDASSIIKLFSLNHANVEASMIKTIPDQLDKNNIPNLIEECIKHNWFDLHALLNIQILSGKDVLQRQLQIDNKVLHPSSFKLISEKIDLGVFIQFALDNPIESLLKVLVDKLSQHPKEIDRIDLKDNTWLNIWELRTVGGIPALQGFKKPQNIVYDLMDIIIDKAQVSESILLSISSSANSDLSKYTNRKNIWSELPSVIRKQFMESTLTGAVEFYLKDPVSNPLEPELLNMVDNNEKIVDLLMNTKDVNQAIISLFEQSTLLNERTLIRHLNKNYLGYSKEDCNRLGHLVKAKKWVETYKLIKNDFKSKNSAFEKTLEICKGIFPLIDSSWLDTLSDIFSTKKSQATTTPIKKQMIKIKKKALILTAIDVEYKAVKSFTDNYGKKTHPTTGSIYGHADFGDSWELLLVETEPGNNNAAIEAERAISFFKPDYVFFVGIAGGLKDVKIGDVVVASKVYGFESAKADKELLSRHEFGQPTNRIKEIAKALRKDEEWLISASDQITAKIGKPFKLDAYFKPIAAGEKVVSSTQSETYKYIKRNAGDSLAVEMEGIGFLKACYGHDEIQYVLIRGISDLVDNKSETDAGGGQELASFTAAAFAFELLNRIERYS